MTHFQANNIDDIYKDVCRKLITVGDEINGTYELNNLSFTLTDISNNVVNVRDISKPYLFGELIWYLTGRQDVDFISKFSKFWTRISDDGVNNNSAYGHILFKRHGFNQVDKIIELLLTDRTSRRAVLNFNVPNPNVIETKDEICTIMLQFVIRDNKLHCTAVMRSNDIWLGTPYDVAFFTELQKYIAHRVGVEYGTYTHFVTSMHVYDRNFEDLLRVLRTKPTTKLSLNIEKLIKWRYSIDALICESATPKDDIVNVFKEYEIYKEENYEN